MNFDQMPTISLAGINFSVDFSVYMSKCSVTELLRIALVSKGFYMMVKNFVEPLIHYSDHIKSFAYGRGLYDNSDYTRHGYIEGASVLKSRLTHNSWLCDDCPNTVDPFNLGDDTVAVDDLLYDLEKEYNTTIRLTDRSWDICKDYLALKDPKFAYVVKYYPVLNEGSCVILLGDVLTCEKSLEFKKLYDYYNQDYQFYLLRPFVIESVAYVIARYERFSMREHYEYG